LPFYDHAELKLDKKKKLEFIFFIYPNSTIFISNSHIRNALFTNSWFVYISYGFFIIFLILQFNAKKKQDEKHVLILQRTPKNIYYHFNRSFFYSNGNLNVFA